jgi:hypothetical protein
VSWTALSGSLFNDGWGPCRMCPFPDVCRACMRPVPPDHRYGPRMRPHVARDRQGIDNECVTNASCLQAVTYAPEDRSMFEAPGAVQGPLLCSRSRMAGQLPLYLLTIG